MSTRPFFCNLYKITSLRLNKLCAKLGAINLTVSHVSARILEKYFKMQILHQTSSGKEAFKVFPSLKMGTHVLIFFRRVNDPEIF